MIRRSNDLPELTLVKLSADGSFFLGWGSLNSNAADVKRTQDPRRTHQEVRGNDTETAEVVRRHE